MRESGGAEKYIRLVKDVYESSMTVMRCIVRVMEVGSRIGSALLLVCFGDGQTES